LSGLSVFVAFKCLLADTVEKTDFSHKLIKEYQHELYETYGVFCSDEEAQLHLQSLVRALFGASGAGAGASARHRTAAEVGSSITPTSGHLDKNI
jgi:hypothetical protein